MGYKWHEHVSSCEVCLLAVIDYSVRNAMPKQHVCNYKRIIFHIIYTKKIKANDIGNFNLYTAIHYDLEAAQDLAGVQKMMTLFGQMDAGVARVATLPKKLGVLIWDREGGIGNFGLFIYTHVIICFHLMHMAIQRIEIIF
ncbi:hypothetical protein ACJX0J_021480 [Zea mays]